MPKNEPIEILDDLKVLVLEWEDFIEYFHDMWEPGQHMALIGPTGEGKTNFMVNLLPDRKYAIALDPKGGDDTLAALEKKGFEKTTWPLKDRHWQDMAEGKPGRFIVGSGIRTTADLPKLRKMIAEVLRDVFDQTGWTVYVDELQVVSDRRLMNLGASIERNVIAARSRKVSMVTSFQRPANVPPAVAQMSYWLIVFFTRDKEVVTRLGEMVGRPVEQIRGLVKSLPPYCVLAFSRRPRDPILITKAPEV